MFAVKRQAARSRLNAACTPFRSLTTKPRNQWSNLFLPTTKGNDLSADVPLSHAHLVKSGFVRQSSSGIYSLLPLGLRTIQKIEAVIDEEMHAIGAQKLALPSLLSASNWKKTGRWNDAKGEFFRLQDRRETDMLLAPTHEEEITQLVAAELKTDKQLPIRLYQIGRKYRDELRPRAGLLRGREFVMKDLYTFDATADDAFVSYDSVSGAYRRIFERLDVHFVVAEADSGNMGGSRSHEYHILSSAGEDTLLTCSKCDYAANQELAVGTIDSDVANTVPPNENDQKMSQILNLSGPLSPSLFSFVVHNMNGETTRQGTVAAVVPAGRSANMTKVTSELSKYLELDAHDVLDLKATQTVHDNITLFCDDAVPATALKGREIHMRGSFRNTVEGDGCHACGAELKQVRAIEAAHTFYLGTKYSDALGCRYGPLRKAAEMGCYGIGISRLLAAVAEVRHDQKGIVWPVSIAPYRVCIIPTNDKQAEFASLTHTIYDTLNDVTSMTDEVIIDDRKGGFGRKMRDAELIGYPFTIVVGQKALTEGIVEVHARRHGANSSIFSVPINTLDTFLQKSL